MKMKLSSLTVAVVLALSSGLFCDDRLRVGRR